MITQQTAQFKLCSFQSLSRVLLCVTPWITAHQASPTITNSQSLPKLCISSQWCHPGISFSVVPFSCSQSLPASGTFPMSQLFAWGGQSTRVSASASVLAVNIQCWFPLGLTGWSPCSPRDSQDSSLAPQFKSIHSSVLSLLYSPTLTSIHDYWKTTALTLMYLCRQSDFSAF